MCTAISFKTKDHYFGRNLDLEHSFNEEVTITPRKYCFDFRHSSRSGKHYAIIGMAYVADNYPLYYDATNEYGLSIAGLNFPGNAVYNPFDKNKENICPFEFIPWVLSNFKNLCEVKRALLNVNLLDEPFNQELPLTPLHWFLSDRSGSAVVEPIHGKLVVYDDPYGLLTNNPPFPYHLENIKNYLNVTALEADNRFAPNCKIEPYSRGMGGIGLPGDLSSSSRYIRTAFTKLNSKCDGCEAESVSQFFHILDSVAQTKGCAQVGDTWEVTQYSSCCNIDKCVYYYKTYRNSRLTAIDLHSEDLDSTCLVRYPLQAEPDILFENR